MKAHRLLHHSTLGLRIIKKKKKAPGVARATGAARNTKSLPRVHVIGPRCVAPRQALRTLSQARSLSHWLVLGAILWAFIAKSYQNLPKLTFD